MVGGRLGSLSLSTREAGLLRQELAGNSWGSSPLSAALIWITGQVGPPAELLLRSLGLGSLLLLAWAAARFCATAGRSPGAGRLAGLCCACQGSLLLTGARLTPAAVLAGLEGVAVLLVMSASPGSACRGWLWRCSGVAVALGLVLVTPWALPLAVALVLGLLLRCGDRPAAQAALIASLVGAAVGFWLQCSSALPSVRLPEWPQVAFWLIAPRPAEGFLGSPSALETAVISAAAVLVCLLALDGLRRAPPLFSGLLVTHLGVSGVLLFGSADPLWSDGAAGLLAAPLFLLAAWRVAHPQGDETGRKVACCVLLVVALASGWRTLQGYRHDEIRAAARLLAAEERPECSDGRLCEALTYYRPISPALGTRRRALLWRPGDDEPRPVYVHAFGQRLGRLWLLRPREPAYDLGYHFPEALVSYREGHRRQACPWDPERQRFFCGGPAYQVMTWTASTFDGVEGQALVVPPLDDGVTELRWNDVPLGNKLFGIAGLDDRSFDFSHQPVTVEIRVADGRPLRLVRGTERGLHPFSLDTSALPPRGSVVVRITTPDDRGRHLFLDLLTLN